MLAQVLTKADMIGGKEVGAAASDVANDVAAEVREMARLRHYLMPLQKRQSRKNC